MRRYLTRRRREGLRLLDRPDVLWHELLVSLATMGNARGYDGLIGDEKLYEQVTFDALSEMAPEDRSGQAETVFREAGVRMPAQKARWLAVNVRRVREMGGPEEAWEAALRRSGRDEKLQFLQQFDGIGPKYARNIWMDLYHPDFRDTIAIDDRIRGITEKLGREFDHYSQHENFYRQIARDANLEAWAVDRLLFGFTDYFETAIDEAGRPLPEVPDEARPTRSHRPDAPASRGTVDTRSTAAPLFERAVEIAARAHAGQTDKAGAPYLLHLLRVGLQQETEAAMIAGVLHDLLEDTAWTAENLEREGFPSPVTKAVRHLTRRPGESYAAFAERAGENPIARQVKIADLEDNMDVTRLDAVEPADAERLGKYLRAWRHLTGQEPDRQSWGVNDSAPSDPHRSPSARPTHSDREGCDAFQEAYCNLESRMRRQATADNQIFVPNPVPPGPVPYVFVCMEPSLGGGSPDRLRSHIENGGRNFLNSMEDFLLHFAAHRYLCGPDEAYHITDISKGAMPTDAADRDRTDRYSRWSDLLQEEIELVARPDAHVFAVGSAVADHLRSMRPDYPTTQILHYSPQAARHRLEAARQSRDAFAAFSSSVSLADILDVAEEVLRASAVPSSLRKETMDQLQKGTLSDSRRALLFRYKRAFEAV
jgi:hypothetical protein